MKCYNLFLLSSSLLLYTVLCPIVSADQTVYVYKRPSGSLLFTGNLLHKRGYKLLRTTKYISQRHRVHHPAASCNLSSLSTQNKKLERYKKMISRLAEAYQLDPLLIRSIISVESCYNSNAQSDKGALGLMQIMPTTKHLNNKNKLYNPMMNLRIGISYFKSLMNRYANNTILALAAYNAGSSAVNKYKGVPPYPQTKHYITKVMMHYHRLVSTNRYDK